MAKTSLQDMRGLPDPLQGYKFDLILSNLPVANALALKLRCRSTQISGMTLEDVTINAHGVDLRYAGRPIWDGNLPATFFETRDMAVRDNVRALMEFCRNMRTNTGEYKENYEFIADVVLYDDRNNIVRVVRHFGAFFKQLDSPATSGDSTPIEYSTGLSYDYHVDL